MNSSLRAPAAGWVGPALLALVWLLLVAGGFPFPHVDEAFFAAAPLNIATGHGLVNSLLAENHPYFTYPPVYPYFFGAWLALFGVSVPAVVAYCGLDAWIATSCLWQTFVLLGQQRLAWIAALGALVYFTCTGLRPDVTASFFLCLSLRCGVAAHPAVRFLAPFLAVLAMTTLPATLAVAVPWLIWLLSTGRRMGWATLAGGLLAGAIVCALVDGQVRDLWAGIHDVAGQSAGIQRGWLRAHWYRPEGLVKSSFPIFACLLSVAAAVRRRGWQKHDLLFLLATALGLYVLTSSFSGQWILALIALTGTAYYLETSRLRPGAKSGLVAASALLVIGAELRHLAQGLTTEKPADPAALRAEVDALPPFRLVVDAWSLRYVFGYHLRPGMIMIEKKYVHLPGTARMEARKAPDECWVISAESVAAYHLQEPGLPRPRPLTIGSHPVGQWLLNAGELALLPPTKP